MATILSFSLLGPIELSHVLLKYRCDSFEHVQRRTVYIRNLNWLTWYLLLVSVSVPGVQPPDNPHRKHRFQQFFYCCVCISVAEETCLRSHCSATAGCLDSWSLAMGVFCSSTILALSHHVTILRWILEKYDMVLWTGFIWLRIGTNWWFLWTLCWTFGFHEMLGNSWVA
jgi:hypothetical protein